MGKKAGKLLKSNAVAVVTRYHAILLDGNDVADAERGTVIVCRVMEVECLIKHFQLLFGGSFFRKLSGIDQIVIAALNGQSVRLYPVHIHKAHIVRVLTAHLINSKTVACVGQESGFPFFLVLLTLHDFFLEHGALLPFLT